MKDHNIASGFDRYNKLFFQNMIWLCDIQATETLTKYATLIILRSSKLQKPLAVLMSIENRN